MTPYVELLRDAVAESGLSQRQIEASFGTPQGSVSRWVRGMSVPPLVHAERLHAAFPAYRERLDAAWRTARVDARRAKGMRKRVEIRAQAAPPPAAGNANAPLIEALTAERSRLEDRIAAIDAAISALRW